MRSSAGLGGQRQSEPIQQNRQIRLRFDIARQGDDPPVVRLGRTVFREGLQLPDVAFLVERLDGALPLLALRVVQLAEVERLTLEDSTTARRCYVRTFVLK